MNELHIEYDSGYMDIHLDAFFPTSQARLRKLLKVVKLDQRHYEGLIETMRAYFQKEQAICKEHQIECTVEWAKSKQKLADAESPEELRTLQTEVRAKLAALQHCRQRAETFTKHLELLNAE